MLVSRLHSTQAGKSEDMTTAESILEQVEEMPQVLTDVHGMQLIHT